VIDDKDARVNTKADITIGRGQKKENENTIKHLSGENGSGGGQRVTQWGWGGTDQEGRKGDSATRFPRKGIKATGTRHKRKGQDEAGHL